jgi:pimeloyl-ACP methyl ester carboxylesterase
MLPVPVAASHYPSIPLSDWRRGGEFFQYRQHRIFYRLAGSGEPLLLIHGFPTASWDYARLWAPLLPTFQLVALDLIGFGFSDKPRDFPYSVAAQADLIEALLFRLGIKECHILAHDYGDTIAQELLARQLDPAPAIKLRAVCFLNGGLFPETHRPLLIQKLLLSPIGPLIARLSSKRRFAAEMTRVFGPKTPPGAAEIDGFWQLVSGGGGLPILAKHIHYMVERRVFRERWVGAIAKAKIPVRLIDGAVDPISGAHMAARYRELIPNADIVLLPETGHYPQVESPELVHQALFDWLSPSLQSSCSS